MRPPRAIASGAHRPRDLPPAQHERPAPAARRRRQRSGARAACVPGAFERPRVGRRRAGAGYHRAGRARPDRSTGRSAGEGVCTVARVNAPRARVILSGRRNSRVARSGAANWKSENLKTDRDFRSPAFQVSSARVRCGELGNWRPGELDSAPEFQLLRSPDASRGECGGRARPAPGRPAVAPEWPLGAHSGAAEGPRPWPDPRVPHHARVAT